MLLASEESQKGEAVWHERLHLTKAGSSVSIYRVWNEIWPATATRRRESKFMYKKVYVVNGIFPSTLFPTLRQDTDYFSVVLVIRLVFH